MNEAQQPQSTNLAGFTQPTPSLKMMLLLLSWIPRLPSRNLMLVSAQEGHGRYKWDSTLSPQMLLNTFQELHQVLRSLMDCSNVRSLKWKIRFEASHFDLGPLTLRSSFWANRFIVLSLSFPISKMSLISDLLASSGYYEVQIRSCAWGIEMLTRISVSLHLPWDKGQTL